MKTSIQVPKAFSISDDRELPLIHDLVIRLNAKLAVKLITTGMHINGGPTVHWGLVYLEDQTISEEETRTALTEAGFDFSHNEDLPPARTPVGETPGEGLIATS